ncbi:carboxypeptidase-like regulatory domain-containing protein [Aureitalea marina]|uniref:Fibronectin type-III domain-containing protein n=1 Tax=Aureitalea marina TaxID=930804 RepID=A0A2S7KMF5_9FLAO|nr:carboxypeptidase regulatory-like domain-containing protein [Aureitalea marina]PQB03814.1 hypothetical protein BST85_02030 [Aureitalea marina]
MKTMMDKKTYLMWTSVLLLIFTFSCNEDRVSENQIGNLRGKVVEAGSNTPIPNAKISTNPTSNTVFTDSSGNYEMNEIPVNDYVVTAESELYITTAQPATVTGNSTTQVVFELERSTTNNRPPTAPQLNSPSQNELISGIEVVFKWSSSDPEEDPITYTLELRNDANNDVLLFEDLSNDSLVYSELMMDTKYFWQVSANDGINTQSVLSPVGTFTVDGPPVDNRFFFTRTVNGNNVIFSADESGNEFQLTPSDRNSYRPKLNVAANLIAFLRTNGADADIYTMERDGSNVRRVTNTVKPSGFDPNEISFAWPTDSDMIYYPEFERLWRINSNGQGRELVYKIEDGRFISEVDINETLDLIAIKVNDQRGYDIGIYLTDMSGVVSDTVIDNVSGAANSVSLSATNNTLVYTYDVSGQENPGYRRFDSRIFIYDRTDQSTTDISGEKPDGTNDIQAFFSPNEAFVIFTNTSNDGRSRRDVFEVNVVGDEDGGRTRTMLFMDAFMAFWK